MTSSLLFPDRLARQENGKSDIGARRGVSTILPRGWLHLRLTPIFNDREHARTREADFTALDDCRHPTSVPHVCCCVPVAATLKCTVEVIVHAPVPQISLS